MSLTETCFCSQLYGTCFETLNQILITCEPKWCSQIKPFLICKKYHLVTKLPESFKISSSSLPPTNFSQAESHKQPEKKCSKNIPASSAVPCRRETQVSDSGMRMGKVFIRVNTFVEFLPKIRFFFFLDRE